MADPRLQGTMLWYSLDRDEGVVQRADGVRFPVQGASFAGGIRPEPRCGGTPITFLVTDEVALDIVVTPESEHRRARLRRSGFR
jgi:hypothetical protein